VLKGGDVMPKKILSGKKVIPVPERSTTAGVE
jgi:hypothetical protein